MLPKLGTVLKYVYLYIGTRTFYIVGAVKECSITYKYYTTIPIWDPDTFVFIFKSM